MQHRPELDRWILEAASQCTGSFRDVGCGVRRNGFLWEERASIVIADEPLAVRVR